VNEGMRSGGRQLRSDPYARTGASVTLESAVRPESRLVQVDRDAAPSSVVDSRQNG